MTSEIYNDYLSDLPAALKIMSELSSLGISQTVIARAFNTHPNAVHHCLKFAKKHRTDIDVEGIRRLGLHLVNGIKETEAA